MKKGSARCRPLERCLRGPKLVRFNVIEAYDGAEYTSHRAAGRIDSPEIGTWLHSVLDEQDFLSPYHAVLNAMTFQWQLAVSDVKDFVMDHRLLEEESSTAIPFSEESHPAVDQPPVHIEPLMILEDWEQIADLFEHALSQGIDNLPLITYGLWNVAAGKRVGACLPNIEAVRQEIHHLWHDLISRADEVKVHMVNPNPEDHAWCLYVVIELITEAVRPAPDARAVLRYVTTHGDGTTVDEAAYHYPGVNGYLVVGQAHLRRLCSPWGEYECTLMIGRRIALLAERAQFGHGSLIEIFVHKRGALGWLASFNLSLGHLVPLCHWWIPMS